MPIQPKIEHEKYIPLLEACINAHRALSDRWQPEGNRSTNLSSDIKTLYK